MKKHLKNLVLIALGIGVAVAFMYFTKSKKPHARLPIFGDREIIDSGWATVNANHSKIDLYCLIEKTDSTPFVWFEKKIPKYDTAKNRLPEDSIVYTELKKNFIVHWQTAKPIDLFLK